MCVCLLLYMNYAELLNLPFFYNWKRISSALGCIHTTFLLCLHCGGKCEKVESMLDKLPSQHRHTTIFTQKYRSALTNSLDLFPSFSYGEPVISYRVS